MKCTSFLIWNGKVFESNERNDAPIQAYIVSFPADNAREILLKIYTPTHQLKAIVYSIKELYEVLQREKYWVVGWAERTTQW